MPADPIDHFKKLYIQGKPVHYLTCGSGTKTMLMVHGYPGRPQDFRWLNEPLHDHFRIIQVAMPGMGYTPLSTWPAPSMTDRVRFLVAFLDALELEHCWLMGHSINGVLAAQLAATHPERIHALILLCSIGLRPHRAYRKLPPPLLFRISQLPGIHLLMTPVIHQLFIAMGFSKRLGREAILHSMRCAYALDFSAIEAQVRRLQCPTMSIWTQSDPLIEAEIASELALQLPDGPRIVFDRGGHNPQKDRAADIASEILAWSAHIESFAFS